ncbi:MAG: DUF480 domain-containing protein [Elusimicrobia bacterium]|nr:DUF480 domain-containing protein [Elusimicrobiota bacterium]
MVIQLNPVEARILGSLVEKSITTPEQYPLSFNALINACNQKSSRDPVMSLDTDTAGRGVASLIEKKLVERRSVPGNRVPKFIHRVENLFQGATAQQIGIICALLLRGPQTPGQIKTRTDRLCVFNSAAEVEGILQDLCARKEDPLVVRLARQTGHKEARYQHLFLGPVAGAATAPRRAPPALPSSLSSAKGPAHPGARSSPGATGASGSQGSVPGAAEGTAPSALAAAKISAPPDRLSRLEKRVEALEVLFKTLEKRVVEPSV